MHENSIREHTDNYTIVAFYPRVFQSCQFIFYHWEGLARNLLTTYTINGKLNHNHNPTHNRVSHKIKIYIYMIIIDQTS
jgi:hypothetical protein